MIIKISDRTPAHLERLEKFFHSKNWVSFPKSFDSMDDPMTHEDLRQVEHPFARLVKKSREGKGSETFTLTLEINPFIVDGGGNNILVPSSFLWELMDALNLFPPQFERESLEFR